MARKAEGRSRALRPNALGEGGSFGRLQSYEIRGLFGRRDFKFFMADSEPTLLTGVNGSGKSTILRTIDAISTASWATLRSVPFSLIALTFESGATVVVRRTDEALIISTNTEREAWTYKDPPTWALTPPRVSLAKRHEAHFETDYKIRPVTEDYIEVLRRHLAIDGDEGPPAWIEALPARFPALFVTDQRLVVEPGVGADGVPEQTPTRAAVEAAARGISAEIASAKSAYANRSQSLDRDFPQRVAAAMASGDAPNKRALNAALGDLEDKRVALEAVGLLAKESTGFFKVDLSPQVLPVISTYVKDAREKLDVLEPLRRRLELFTTFLNRHYRSKIVITQPELGFVIALDDGGLLAPSQLSSGEQQMLVLAHHILFRTKPSTLVLIDEPELSLHVSWQATFVDDLTEMGRVAALTFLLATHSPTLIGGREDLKRSLDVMARK